MTQGEAKAYLSFYGEQIITRIFYLGKKRFLDKSLFLKRSILINF